MRALTFERVIPSIQNPLLAAAVGSGCGVLVVILAASGSPTIAAAALGGLLVAGAAVLFPDFAFLLVALSVHLERLGRFTNDTEANAFSLMRIVGALALGSFLLHALMKRWKINFGAAFLVYTAYACWGAVTVFFTNDRLGAMQTGGQVIGNLMFLFLTINIVRNWKLVRAGVVAWLIVVVLAGIWTIYGWHFQGASRAQGESNVGVTDRRFQATYVDNSTWDRLESVGRAQGTSSHPSVYGLNLIFTIPFFFYFLRVSRNLFWKAMTAGGLVISLYNIFLTNTRATFFVAGIIVVLCVLRRVYALTPHQLIALLLLASASLYFVPTDVYTRVLDPTSYAKSGSQEGSLMLRTHFWEAAYEVLQTNWLFGVGMGNQTAVPSKVRVVTPERISAHNEYINTLMEVGIIGWILLFTTVGIFIWSSFKAAAIFRRLPGHSEQYYFMLAAQITIIAALLYGVQVDVFHFPLKGWWLIAGLSVSMLWIAQKDAQQEQQERITVG
jgi:hypothetical protein